MLLKISEGRALLAEEAKHCTILYCSKLPNVALFCIVPQNIQTRLTLPSGFLSG